MSTVQILSRQTIANQKYPLQRIVFEKPDKEGTMHHQENEVYFRPDAVAVLLVDEKAEKILLTRQFRLPTFLNGSDTGYLIEACAGLIDNAETAEDAAHREVMEETGYEITHLVKYAGVYSSAGGITEYVHLFCAAYNSGLQTESGGGLKEEGEDIELLELSIPEARQQLLSGVFKDGKTIMLLHYYFAVGFNNQN